MDMVLLAFVVCTANVICFALGVTTGRAMDKAEPRKPLIPLPKIPKVNGADKREMEAVNVILENIDNYDGTPEGQKDVPWR